MTNNFKDDLLSELERIKWVVPRNVDDEKKWYEACDKAIKNIEQLKEPDELKAELKELDVIMNKQGLTKEVANNVELELRETKDKDNIVSPIHYTSDKGFEVFDVQEAFIHELKGMSASYWCNVVKYILRFQRKNGVEDLKKAKYYLEKLIEKEESK